MKETLFVEENNNIYVPRPTSVAAGQSRSIWILKTLNKKSSIVSPDLWEHLKKNNKLKKLIETENGFEIIDLS